MIIDNYMYVSLGKSPSFKIYNPAPLPLPAPPKQTQPRPRHFRGLGNEQPWEKERSHCLKGFQPKKPHPTLVSCSCGSSSRHRQEDRRGRLKLLVDTCRVSAPSPSVECSAGNHGTTALADQPQDET